MSEPTARPWQPIETAPSDGRYILVWGGRFETVDRVQADGGYWRHQKDKLKSIPTHWMPLPEPPGALAAVNACPALEEAERALEQARLQIEYLHEKFQETGSGNNVLAQITAALARIRAGRETE